MPRNATVGTTAQFSASPVTPVFFVEAEFTDGFQRIWSGIGPKSWNGYTWAGVGALLGFSRVNDTTEIKAENVNLSLNGLDPAQLPRLMTMARQGKPVTCWIGFLDASGNIINAPTIAFAGRQDTVSFDDPAAGPVTAVMSVESRMRDLDRTRERRYTDQDQRSEFPADTGMRFVAGLQDWNGTTSSGSGITLCTCADQFLLADVRVRNAHEFIGRKLDVLDAEGRAAEGTLLRCGGITMEPCVRLVAANGRACSYSVNTPFDIPGGAVVKASEMLNYPIATDAGHGTEVEWSIVAEVQYLGWREVLLLDFGGLVFASGETPDGRLYSHNMGKQAQVGE